MDKETLRSRREHEFGFYRSKLSDPGPVNPSESRSWNDRYFAMASVIQPYLGAEIPGGSIDANRTPRVEVEPATEDLPAVYLYLVYGNTLGNRIAARWEYEHQPEGRNFIGRDMENGIDEEFFCEDWLRDFAPETRPNLTVSLNRLEHSVALYVEAATLVSAAASS